MSFWGDPADTADLSEGIDRHVEAADLWEGGTEPDPNDAYVGAVVDDPEADPEPDDPKASLVELARATGVLADTAERAVRDLRVAVDMLTASVK